MIPLCSFPEKKVCKNTFQAFTGKLDKPIESKFKGGNGSLEGWMLLTSLNHEQSARYGYAISLQIINEREVPGNAWEFTEKKKQQGFIERNTNEVHDWNLWDKMMAQFIVCMFLQQNTITSRKSIFTLICHCSFSHCCPHVSQVGHIGTNRIPLRSAALLSAGCSGTMTSILLDISVKITIFLKDTSHRNGFRLILLSRSNRVSLIFGYAGMKVARLEMCRRIAIFTSAIFKTDFLHFGSL